MGSRENVQRITRLAAKRKAEQEMMNSQLSKRNRVVLGEIGNVGCVERGNLVDGKRITKAGKKGTLKSKETVILKEENICAADDPQMCAEYVSDIYQYLHKMEIEIKRRPLSDYLRKVQIDMTANMRGILIDWLVEVAEEFKLESDTLFLSVNYIDRFLSKNVVSKQKLQLLGVSSMLIASKYEEITPPNIEQFCYITDNTYNKEEVLKMESDILNSLGFEMGNPTVNTFLRRVTDVSLQDCKSDSPELEFMGCYLAELSLLDYQCVKFLPSLIASSIVFLARFILSPQLHPWSSSLQQHSGYKAEDLKECVGILHDLQLRRSGGPLMAIRDKYNHSKFGSVSTISSPLKVPSEFFESI